MSVDMSRLKREGYSFTSRVCQGHLLDILRRIGRIRVDPRSPELVRDISPQSIQSAKENTLSSRYGTGAFPFHTDTAHWDRPAEYLALYCVDPGQGNRPTLLQDFFAWQLDDAEEDLACRALWKTGHVRPRLCTLAERTRERLSIRYDAACMQPMTAEAHELQAIINSRIRRTTHNRIEWKPECLLLIDNGRIVHARGRSRQPEKNRVLKRILVGGD
jgi:L-asparagine oxygenase